jgi:Na+/melibiose symporter-like transporter
MLRRLHRLYYGLGRLGSQALLSFIDLASFWLYMDLFGLGPILSMVGFCIGKLVIAISGPLVGYLSDVTWLRGLGRRKPFMILGAPGLAISCVLAFMPGWFVPLGDTLAVLVYMVITMAAFNLFYAVLMTPYQALMPEITVPSERVVVSTYQMSAQLLGQVVGTIGGFALPMLVPLGLNTIAAFIVPFGVLECFCFVPSILVLREAKEELVPQPGLRLAFSRILGNRNYRNYLLLQCTMTVPTAMLGRIVLPYADYVLRLIGVQYIAMALILLGFTFVFFFVWTKVSHRTGRKRVPLVISMVLLMVVLPTTLFLGQAPLGAIPSYLQGAFFIGLIAAGVSGWYLLPNPITADIVHEHQDRMAEGRAGGYEGFINLPLNIFQIGATIMAALLLSLPALPPNAYSQGYILWGPVAALFVVPSIAVGLWLVETDPLRMSERRRRPESDARRRP